jgi:hypothetical protein
MRLRLAGLVLAAISALAYLALVVPVRREAATLVDKSARAREARDGVRRSLAAVEAERQRSFGTSGDPVRLALSIRPGLVACLESAGLLDVEFAFTGSAGAALRLQAMATGDLPSTLEAIDCVLAARPGVVPEAFSLTRIADRLRLGLEMSPGEISPPIASPWALVRDPFAEQAGPVDTRKVAVPSTRPDPVTTVSPPPAPPEEPAVRLVGVLHRSGGNQAALSIRGEVVLLPVGGSAAGYTLVSVDPESGAVVRDPSGAQTLLELPR